LAYLAATLALVVAMGSGMRAARAADPDAEELIRQGVAARKRGDDAGALELFRRARDLGPSPHATAQKGLAEMALGRWVDAETDLQDAIATQDPWVVKNHAVLQGALDSVREQLGSLEVIGSPPGAEIVIEGRVAGTLPLGKPLRLRVGEARFEVRAPGFVAVTRTVQITSASSVRESVDLAQLTPEPPAVAPPAATPAPAVTPPAPVPSPPAEAARESPVSPPPGPGRLRTGGLIVGAAGVAGLAASMAFGLEAMSANNDSNANGHCDSTGCDAIGLGHRNDAFNAARVSTILFITGTALAAGGVALYFLGRGPAAERRAALGLGPMFAGGGGGLAVTGGF
jgi:hypothetical protein